MMKGRSRSIMSSPTAMVPPVARLDHGGRSQFCPCSRSTRPRPLVEKHGGVAPVWGLELEVGAIGRNPRRRPCPKQAGEIAHEAVQGSAGSPATRAARVRWRRARDRPTLDRIGELARAEPATPNRFSLRAAPS